MNQDHTLPLVVEKCFLENSTHMKAVSSVSKGRGILSKPQFTMALARIAVELLDMFHGRKGMRRGGALTQYSGVLTWTT